MLRIYSTVYSYENINWPSTLCTKTKSSTSNTNSKIRANFEKVCGSLEQRDGDEMYLQIIVDAKVRDVKVLNRIVWQKLYRLVVSNFYMMSLMSSLLHYSFYFVCGTNIVFLCNVVWQIASISSSTLMYIAQWHLFNSVHHPYNTFPILYAQTRLLIGDKLIYICVAIFWATCFEINLIYLCREARAMEDTRAGANQIK